MAIDRFQNKDILVSSKVPVDNVQVYDLEDLANLSSEQVSIPVNELDTQTQVETHIYSADKLIASLDDIVTHQINTNADDPYDVDILIKPEATIRTLTNDTSAFDSGYYSLVYNFLKPQTVDLKVKNISSDATELELEVVNPNHFLNQLTLS